MDREQLLDALCERARGWQLLFVVSLVTVIILLPSFRAVEPGSATYVVVVVQLVGFGIIGVLAGSVLYVCMQQ